MLREDKVHTTLTGNNEGNFIDLFGFEKEEYEPGKYHTANFRRDSTLDEDILALIKKFKGKPQEILVRHMVDSLILFNHNRNQVQDVNTSSKFGNTDVWEATQIQRNS